MGASVGRLCVVGLAVVMLSGCGAGGTAAGGAETAGAIDVALSEACPSASTDGCVDVNGEKVIAPAEFARAEVTAAAAAEDQPGHVVDITLSNEGAEVLESTTAQAVEVGDTARLVIRVGDDLVAAVIVAEPLTVDRLALALPDGTTTEEFIDAVART